MYATDTEVVIPICSACGLVEDKAHGEAWSELGSYLDRHGLRTTSYKLTQTYCPSCFRRYFPSNSGRKGEDHVTTQSADALTGHILSMVRRHPWCTLDTLVQACPDYTWNQIFLAVDRLSRTGDIELSCAGPGQYNLGVPASAREHLQKMV